MSEKTHAEIIAEMRNRAKRPDFVSQDVLKSCADELDAAHRRERGDAAKLREALEKVNEIANKEWDASRETSAMWEIWEICTAALADTSNQNTQEEN